VHRPSICLAILLLLLAGCGDYSPSTTAAEDAPDVQVEDTQLPDTPPVEDDGEEPDSGEESDPGAADPGQPPDAQGTEPVTLENALLKLVCAADGACDLLLADGEVAVKRAWSSAEYRVGDGEGTFTARSIDADSVTLKKREEQTSLGPCEVLEMEAQKAGAPTLVTELRVYGDGPFVTIDLAVRNDLSETLGVAKMTPWKADALDDGGLFVGKDPKDHVVLDNGQLRFMDFEASLHHGLSDTMSNWSAAIVDRETDEGVVAGALSMERSVPMVAVRNTATKGLRDDATGRLAFAGIALESIYSPRKAVAVGESFGSERAYVDAATRDPFEGLEDLAERIRLNLGYELWDGAYPNGWNSWAASGSTGGYGTSINEEIMLANLDFMAENLRDYGINYFQMDDGWQDQTGDWNPHPERFPHGLKWFADRVREKGLIPGLWIEPMTVSKSSKLYADHPDWLVEGPDGALLDPSIPEVREHLTALFRKVSQEWGFKWVKIDFAYRLLLTQGYADPSLTSEEVYRLGLKAARAGLDDDTFLLTVAGPGLNFDISHANRLTLDTMPYWNDKTFLAGQGMADVARTVSRRWFLHGRAQINHPDLIVFREEGTGGTPPDQPNPMRPLNETTCYSTMVGLSGGIVKIGDRMAVDLGPDQVDVLRRILPSYEKTGRPIDVFDRTIPEIWVLPVTTAWQDWTLVSLTNWGLNGSGLRIDDTEEKARDFSYPFERLDLDPAKRFLAFEYWKESFFGEVTGTLEVAVEPRHVALVALRELREGEVQLLATNRHVTMGATDIKSVTWDSEQGVLEGEQEAVAGWPYRLFFHVPEGLEVTAVKVGGEDAAFELPHAEDPKLLLVTFTTESSEDVTWRVETAAR